MTNSDNENENENVVDVKYQNEVQLNLLPDTQIQTLNINDDAAQIKKNNSKSDDKKEVEAMMREMTLTDDTTCGYGFCKFKFLQRFANQTTYVIIYGIVGCILAAGASYFNGIITTLEKRYKIPSKNMGIISVSNDISTLILSALLSYFGGKGHRPRWISFGLLTIIISDLMNFAPHLIYGSGEDALSLTTEFGNDLDQNSTTSSVQYQERTKSLCHVDGVKTSCQSDESNFTLQIILFISKIILGIGECIYYTLGVAYMDDNAKKSETPMLISFSFFLKYLGPPIGLAMASFCLKHYISPDLHPTITTDDPRWLGAWWIGWLIHAVVLFIFTLFYVLFPKELPQAVARRRLAEKRHEEEKLLGTKSRTANGTECSVDTKTVAKASFKDMWQTYKRLMRNKLFVFNTLSSVFFIFGAMPYWIFTPKYIETQYRQSAAISNMVTGSVALIFTAIGILASGFVISKLKPSARSMAAWNTLVNLISVVGMISYAFVGCSDAETKMVVNIHENALNATPTCNSACACDYVRYSPVCGENTLTYISPCHAGCKSFKVNEGGSITYTDCECIQIQMFDQVKQKSTAGIAAPGSCVVNCFQQFVTFLAIMCCLKFFGASGRASNFLLSARCVEERDKTTSFGIAITVISIFSFMPSPIFFGWIFDRVCLVWGKTCTNNGNCWLYDSEALRYSLNLTAAAFVSFSVIFEIVIWYYAKNLQIFDEEDQKEDKIKRTFSTESINAERI